MTTPETRPQHKTAPFAIVIGVLVLIGFFGQLLLQGFSLPKETPRAAIERLTGIDISPQRNMGHDMAMMDMPMGMSGHHHDTHHQDKSCPLCPLLELVAVILTSLPALPAYTVYRYQQEMRAHPPRAPPSVFTGLPPSRGPPLFS
ncbi:MAG: DUF2946 domain-containing protein [Acetobacter syzygii]|uniref:DUF2946 domain-containing protein n=1 Tax=Acetobacter syzygii TaxID=146476 RepID=UPI0039EB004F